MEIRIQRIFLKTIIVSLLSINTYKVFAFESETNKQADESSISDIRVFDPQVERREVNRDAIDTENWELGLNYGIISIEDFGTSEIVSFNAAYHVSEDFFLSLNYGKATAGESSFEVLTNISLLQGDQSYIHYSIGLGFNLLPGEGFIGKNTAFTSVFYILAGLGTTEFANDNRSTLVFGGGYQVLFNDWLSMNIAVRDNLYDIELIGPSKVANDIEISTGFTVFF